LSCTLRRSVVEAVVEHAERERPSECCGLLIGRADEILEAIPARNLAGNPNRFLIDPQAHVDARRAARLRGLAVVGFYHSHPHSPPQPSARDLAEVAYEDALHLIVSLQTHAPVLCVFELNEGGFVEVPFVEVP
jgi:proteasome lid subunit RPN8/RPN11